MRLYETMLLLDPRQQDGEIEETLNRFQSLVTEQGGEMTGVERWGRRRLAYEISGLQEGYYALLTYRLEPDKRHEIEQAIPFFAGLVRSKTVRPEPRSRGV